MSVETPPSSTSPSVRRFALWSFIFFVVFSAALKLPSLSFALANYDEIVYWEFTKALWQTGHYTLQGSPLLQNLPPAMYDKPLFHHPPGFFILLAPFVLTNQPSLAHLVGWAGHWLTMFGVAILGYELFLRGRTRLPLSAAVAYMVPIFLAALDPILLFLSGKVWMDGLLGGLLTTFVAAFTVFLRNSRLRWLWIASLSLALACSLKIIAAVALPFGLIAWLSVRGMPKTGQRWKQIGILILPSLLVLGPWLVLFFATYGVFTPYWLRPDPQLIAANPFVRAALARPWWYYEEIFLASTPLAWVLLVMLFKIDWRGCGPGITLGWIVCFLVVMTWLGHTGMSREMRYASPAIGAIYLLVPWYLKNGTRRNVRLGFLTLALVLSGVAGAVWHGYYLHLPAADEFVPSTHAR